MVKIFPGHREPLPPLKMSWEHYYYFDKNCECILGPVMMHYLKVSKNYVMSFIVDISSSAKYLVEARNNFNACSFYYEQNNCDLNKRAFLDIKRALERIEYYVRIDLENKELLDEWVIV